MNACRTAALAASISLALVGAAAMAATPAPPAATALPGQGAVTAGAATGTVTGSTLAVALTANSVINWGGANPTINKTGTAGFNVGSSATVNFTGAFGVLNVDTSGNASQIFGKMTSAGDLYVANANGIIVGSGATITGGGAVG